MLRLFLFSLAAVGAFGAFLVCSLLSGCEHDDEEFYEGHPYPVPPGYPPAFPGPLQMPDASRVFETCPSDSRREDPLVLRAFAACITRASWTESGIEVALREGAVAGVEGTTCTTCHSLGLSFESVNCGLGRSTLFRLSQASGPAAVVPNHDLLRRMGDSEFHSRYQYNRESALFIAVEKLYAATERRQLDGSCSR